MNGYSYLTLEQRREIERMYAEGERVVDIAALLAALMPWSGSGEYLHNADENENAFCGQCGQAIDWSDVE